MTEKCAAHRRAAGIPATAPTATAATGAVSRVRAMERKRLRASTGSPTGPRRPAPVTDPPPPSWNRTRGSLSLRARSST